MTDVDPIAEANTRYIENQRTADQSKEALLDLCAQRVRDGLDTADTLAMRTAFTAVTIRKALRARGVEALPPGPRKANR